MFTYVKVKNFKSLKDITINFNKTKTKTNKFVAIYGENGSGKTNIVELFKVLQESVLFRSKEFATKNFAEEILNEERNDVNVTGEKYYNVINKIFHIKFNFNEYRTLKEKEATEIEYGFKINNKEGYYYIKFTDKLIEEKLYYMVDKQRGFLFEIKKEEDIIKRELNKNIFKNEKYNEELLDLIDKYWGKYSFLSLLTYERKEKNKEYINNNISNNIFQVIDEIISTTIQADIENLKLFDTNFVRIGNYENIQEGFIKNGKIEEIKKYEEILNIFFTQGYADIKEVKYKIIEKEDGIYYKLYFYKLIGGEIKEIPYSQESEGTKKILDEFDSLIGALIGETVIIDEIDNGIHDLLMKNIIMSIKDEITGQLIITTHNTLLLEVLPKESIYILTTNYNGNKTINCIKDYDVRVQKNNNARTLYLKGIFGGIPTTNYIDFEEIKYELNELEKENANDKKSQLL